MTPPIVVIGAPRTGTSLVAGIFAEHGCWTGECKPPDEDHPHGIWENKRLYEILHELGGEPGTEKALRGEVASHDPRFLPLILDLLLDQGYRGGPWVMKHGSEWWRMWDSFNPVFVVTHRSEEATKKAWAAHGGVVSDSKVALDTYRHACRQCVRAGGFEVYPRDIVAGDYRSLGPAFLAAGLELDPEIVEGVVVPDQWHHV